MAKNQKKSKGVAAGDLFGKLRRGKENAASSSAAESVPEEELDLLDSIDATSDADSDSDLDIHALLKKYMPEYQENADAADDGSGENQSGAHRGILSALKQSAVEEQHEEDEKLMDTLDSAFSVKKTSEPEKEQPMPESISEEELEGEFEEEPEEEPFVEELVQRLRDLDAERPTEKKKAARPKINPNIINKTAEEAPVSQAPDPKELSDALQAKHTEPEPIPEEESEPVLPFLSSMLARQGENGSKEEVKQPQPEPKKAEEPAPKKVEKPVPQKEEPAPKKVEEPALKKETPALKREEPVPKKIVTEPDGDELLTDIAPDDEETDEEGPINLTKEEKRRALFGLLGKKKKPSVAADPPVSETAAPNVAKPKTKQMVKPKTKSFEELQTEQAVKQKIKQITKPEQPAKPKTTPTEKPKAKPAEKSASEQTGEPKPTPPEEPKPEQTAEPNAAEPKAQSNAKPIAEEMVGEIVSEEKLAEMVREMEDREVTVEPEDGEFGFDLADLDLMVAFGLDQKSGKGYDKAKEFGDKLQARQEDASRNKIKLDRPEFVDKTQARTIYLEYKRRETSLWIRLLLCAVFAAALLIFENIETFTGWFTGSPKQFAGIFDFRYYPTVYIMTSLQLMLLACLCAYDEILYGLRWLFRGAPRPQSITALLNFAGIVYSAVAAQLNIAPEKPRMFNFLVAFASTLTLVSAIYNVKRERMNFRVVANKRPKHIVRRLRDEESEGETEAFADASNVCDVMKIEKTDFVEGFFARLQKQDPSTGVFVACLMSIIVAAAVLFGLFVKFRGGVGTEIAGAIFASMLLLCPLSIFIAFAYPYFRANVAARAYESAIIGESAVEEYSNASIISFDDKNVFPSYAVKVQNIRIYNNARIDRVLFYAASAFSYAGGPLRDVFEVATREMGISKNVKIIDTEAGFLAAKVDGVNIIFGKYDVLTSRGLVIDERAAQEDVDVSDELEIMYMFREKKLVAKMYVKYVMDADIDPILKQFSNSGLYVCVRTFDPNIDERMIAKKLNVKKMPLKIVRYVSADEVVHYEAKVDSGLVTCGSPKSLLQVISFCGKVLQSKKTNVALSVLSVLIGASILVLLLLANSLDKLSSLSIALYQILWLIIISVSSRAYIR